MKESKQTSATVGFQTIKETQFPLSWLSFWSDVGKFAIGVLLLLLSMVAVSMVMSFSIDCFWRKSLSTFPNDNVERILEQIAWPCTVVFVVVIFRNAINRLLAATAQFALKSHYRYENKSLSTDKYSQFKMDGNNELESVAVDVDKPAEQTKKVETSRQLANSLLDLAAKEIALNKIQTEASIPVFRGCSIVGLNFKFDGTIEFPDETIWGIKVSRKNSSTDWENDISKLATEYSKWKPELQRKFVFVACAVGTFTSDQQNSIADIVHSLPCNVLVRFWKYNGQEYKEFQ